MGKIKTTLTAQNFAPLKNVKGVIDSDSLRITIYADNGEGKTFISKAFRLTENVEMPLSDKYLSFGESKGKVTFCISNEGKEIEKFEIILEKDKPVVCLKPVNYIFHTFNQEYIEENIRSVSFDKKKDNIDGYIIGKAKIDLKDDEDKLKIISDKAAKQHSVLQNDIDNAIKSIEGIYNIKRINEYRLLTKENIFTNYTKPISDISKSVKQYIEEYDLIKSIPENIEMLNELRLPTIDDRWLGAINDDLKQSFSVSSIAEDFKEKVKAKQFFIEEGVKLLPNDGKCPFCEQPIYNAASVLLGQYVAFFNEEEAKHIKQFRDYIHELSQLKQKFIKFQTEVLSGKSRVSDYILKYLPFAENKVLDEFDATQINELIDEIIKVLNEKIKNIAIIYVIDEANLEILEKYKLLQITIESNNARISEINRILSDSTEANRNIRRNICKALFNDIIDKVGPLIDEYIKLTDEKDKIITSINQKRQVESVKRLDKVSETIKKVLNVFFSSKYTFDDSNFLLQCQGTLLQSGNASNVLSEGEKSIIAFAYYLGDVFIKITKEEDYEKLFFVIDDPISSMDFNYVYVLSTIIRNLESYIPIPKHVRIILLTHNLEFMRIIVGNRIMGNCYILKNNELKKFNSSYTIPYISHLNDIYLITIGRSSVNHTTANSIRHILESLLKFENPQSASLEEYVKMNFPDDIYTYTLIQDLSHGGIRAQIDPIKDENYLKICKHVIDFLGKKYPGQLEYCKTLA